MQGSSTAELGASHSVNTVALEGGQNRLYSVVSGLLMAPFHQPSPCLSAAESDEPRRGKLDSGHHPRPDLFFSLVHVKLVSPPSSSSSHLRVLWLQQQAINNLYLSSIHH